jgi:hypothetical protein
LGSCWEREKDESKERGSDLHLGLRENQASLGLWNLSPKFLRRFDPFTDHDFDIRESFLVGFAIGSAARKLRHFRDESLIGLTPINDDFVLRHVNAPRADI